MKLVQRVPRIWREFLQYVKSHLWFSLTGTMMLIFLLAALIFQTYLKKQYYDYLLAKTWQTENALLSATSVNLDGQLSSALRTGSEIAVNQDLRDAIDQTLESSSDERLRSLMTLDSKLGDMSYYSPNVMNVAIITKDGLLQEYGRNWRSTAHPGLWSDMDAETISQLYADVHNRILEEMVGRYVVTAQPAFHRDFPLMQMFHIALPVLGGATTFQDISSVVVVSFHLNSIIQSGALSDSGQEYAYGYLTDGSGTVFYHDQKDLIGIDENAYLNQSGHAFLSQPLNYFEWSAHIVIDTENLQDNVNQMYNRGIVIYLLLICLCGAVWNMLIRRILRPVGLIGGAMNEIRSGKPDRKIEVSGTHELWQLAGKYNDMLDALHEQQREVQRHFEEKTRSIEQKNRAEREALESQINAHFLCNTLNAINYNVLESGNTEVSVLLKKLSNILHYTFSQKTQDVTLGQELEWVQQYLYLQKYRLGDRFSYQVDFPEDYREWPCCKLVLQPFVENSILHGFKNMESGGMIWITGCPEQERFRIEIRDNGCGMSPAVKETIQRSIQNGQALFLDGMGTGIGIRNVITRMKMFFGERFSVQMETTENEGTCFTFWLPIPPLSEEEDFMYDQEEGRTV